MATVRKYDKSTEGFNDWTFSTVRCWGEKPTGTWKLVMRDNEAGERNRGILRYWRITMYGSSMTESQINARKRLVQRASSGAFLQKPGPPCPAPPNRNRPKPVISSKALKIILLLSGFFFLVGLYFIIETLCDGSKKTPSQDDIVADDDDDDDDYDDEDLESITFSTPTKLDPDLSKEFFSKTLAEDDALRLHMLLDRSNTSRIDSEASLSVIDASYIQREQVLHDSLETVNVLKDSDHIQQTFEDRLKKALEQSLLLQQKQLQHVAILEDDLKIMIGSDECLGPADKRPSSTSALVCPPKKLKGILKKTKQYKD